MPRALLSRPALRRLLVMLSLLLLVPLAWEAPGVATPVAEAIVRTPRGWTVAPGNAAEIQPAIDAARDAGGGAVFLPAGLYQLTLKVRVHSNVTVYGDGMDRTVLRWAPGATLDHMMSNASLTAGNANLQVRDLTLDGGSIASGRTDCCFGLRLNNVQNSFVVNVAADGHSLDGIYLGYNRSNGVNNVRVSGCRANGNARNGISLLHGTGNVIDHCRVEGNNRRQAVAGIDIEPDQGLAVTNSKIVGNIANGQNVGIQLFVAYNGYATNGNNAVCYNAASGNASAGIYDYRGSANIFVNNQTSGNGTNFLVDDSSLVGSQYAGACELGALPPSPGAGPTPTPTQPTPTPTQPPASCQPRPAIDVRAVPSGSGTLQVTVTATRGNGAPANTVRLIQFGAAQNATITMAGQTQPGNFSISPPPGTQQVTFTVRRVTAGQPVTVPIVVTDDCGAWPTFVGGGPAAF